VYEVEQKYPLADVAAVEAALARLGATWHGTAEQVDRYFNHPCRDFAVTDEALRLRRTDAALAITWKGPRLDATAKTRREIELPLAQAAVPAAAVVEAAVPAAALVEAAVPAAALVEAAVPAAALAEAGVAATLDRWTELLEALGFRQVRQVAKQRRLATVAWHGAAIDVALDHVTGLGTFVELELQADAAGIADAATRIESLARELGCTAAERRSYLEMLIQHRGGAGG
jgi:adenylate cyclase, class 2